MKAGSYILAIKHFNNSGIQPFLEGIPQIAPRERFFYLTLYESFRDYTSFTCTYVSYSCTSLLLPDPETAVNRVANILTRITISLFPNSILSFASHYVFMHAYVGRYILLFFCPKTDHEGPEGE